MISLTVLGAHQTLLRITPDKGTIKEILFSYETPVAAWTSLQGTMRTATIYSRTTEKHIKTWLHRHNVTNVQTVPQDTINMLLV